MTTMNISLPEGLKNFVDGQVSEGEYSSTSEYLRELIRKDSDRVRLREMLLEGAKSEVVTMDAAYFEGLREKARRARK